MAIEWLHQGTRRVAPRPREDWHNLAQRHEYRLQKKRKRRPTTMKKRITLTLAITLQIRKQYRRRCVG
jgi:hypothetical protein